jgi:hypothetical protein
MVDKESDRRRKGTFTGLALIAFGAIGAVIGYYNDAGSFDVIRMLEAKNYAVLHLVLWTIAGLCVIGWAHLSPEDRGDDAA